MQTGIAVGRTALNVRKIKQQTYATGGFTEALKVDGGGRLIDGTGEAVAGVVHADEWVSPRWTTESPKYAPVIRWLESERTRKFAEGGFTAPTGSSSMPGSSMDLSEMQDMMNGLRTDLQAYATRVDAWARHLRVINDPRDTRDALQTLNEVDRDSDL